MRHDAATLAWHNACHYVGLIIQISPQRDLGQLA